jgi:hypothetical protein
MFVFLQPLSGEGSLEDCKDEQKKLKFLFCG